MNKFSDSALFSLFISLSMVMLDGIYHLATETVVHINYMGVKFTLIFLTLFLVIYWIGKGLNAGILACITGPIIFYIYYIFADPTINREFFKIDETFGYIFLHIAVFVISYAIMYNLTKNKGTKLMKVIGIAFIFSLVVLSLDTAYQLEKVQLTTHNEEIGAKLLSFDTTFYLFLMLFIIAFICFYYIKDAKLRGLAFSLLAGAAVYVIGRVVLRTAVSFLLSIMAFTAFSYYLSRLEVNYNE